MPEYIQIAVDDLQTFGGNPRRGDVDAIAESLERHGQYRPIVVNAGSLTGRRNEVLAGNHTLKAARSLGWAEIDVALLDVDDETAKAIVAADNHLADLGGYDSGDLYALLASLEDLDGTGYTGDDLAALERELFPPEPLTDPDDVPVVPADPVSRLGQVWHLGEHRLLVGDSTDMAAVAAMFGDERADCVWTDPPYGVDYVGGDHTMSTKERKERGGKTIQNDLTPDQLPTLLDGAFAVVRAVCKPGAAVYVAHPDSFRTIFQTAFEGAGLLFRQNLIWNKDSMVLCRTDYHYKHEPILYGFAPAPRGSGRLGRGGDRWYGDNRQTTVFDIARPARSTDHPTMKPVALIDAMLANSLAGGGSRFRPVRGVGFDAHRRAWAGRAGVRGGARPALRGRDLAAVRGAHRGGSGVGGRAGVVRRCRVRP